MRALLLISVITVQVLSTGTGTPYQCPDDKIIDSSNYGIQETSGTIDALKKFKGITFFLGGTNDAKIGTFQGIVH